MFDYNIGHWGKMIILEERKMNKRNATIISLLCFILFTNNFSLGYLGDTITVNQDPNAGADFTSIQDAINFAWDFDTIIVHPGIYEEHINYNGTLVTITSIDPNDPNIVETTIIDGSGNGSVVMFYNAEGQYASLNGFTIQNGAIGIHCKGADTSPLISKCIVKENNEGILCYLSSPNISYSSIAYNTKEGIKDSYGNTVRCEINNNGAYGIQSCHGDINHCIVRENNQGGIKSHKGNISNTLIHNNFGDGINIPFADCIGCRITS